MTSSIIDPWLIIGLAAYYEAEMHKYDSEGQYTVSSHFDSMLSALQQLVGLMLHNDIHYFTFGPGNDEYVKNIRK